MRYGYATQYGGAREEAREQRERLARAGCNEIVTAYEPEALDGILSALTGSDTLVVASIHRLAATPTRLRYIVGMLYAAGASLEVLDAPQEDRSPLAALNWALDALAALRRDASAARIKAGFQQAKEAGRLGRRPALNSHERAKVAEMLASGEWSQREVARFFEVSRATIQRVWAAHLREREAREGESAAAQPQASASE